MCKLFSILTILLSFLLTACITVEDNYAPVTEVSVIEPIPKKGKHKVLPDETLYAIAWRYGLDYRDLAKKNNIAPPYAISTGQIIYLTKNQPRNIMITKNKTPIINPPKNPAKMIIEEPIADVTYWKWPAIGPIIGRFSSSNKGIDIAGHHGDPIYTTATGKVVYSGNGLRGYGNLIIIKHNSMLLTAYAHNSKSFVQSGDWVKNGQKIAEMGNTGTQRTMLHFEIRRNGKPIDPLLFLNRVRHP